MNHLLRQRYASGLLVLFTLGSLGGCIVLPFGHDEGEHRAEHGERGSRDHLYPNGPRWRPSRDAGDTGLIERVRLAPGDAPTLRLNPYFRPAVYLPPRAPPPAARLLG